MQLGDAKLPSETKTVPAVGKVAARVFKIHLEREKGSSVTAMKGLPKVKIRCTVKCIKTGAKQVKRASKFSF